MTNQVLNTSSNGGDVVVIMLGVLVIMLGVFVFKDIFDCSYSDPYTRELSRIKKNKKGGIRMPRIYRWITWGMLVGFLAKILNNSDKIVAFILDVLSKKGVI